MPKDISFDYDGQANTLSIHFDVEEHHIRLDTFIQTAESARRIISSLDSALFGSSLNYEVVVLPPDEGTFLQKLKVIVPVAAGIVLFLDSDTPAGFIEGLTGKPPSEWAKSLGELIEQTAEIAVQPAVAKKPDESSTKVDLVAQKRDEILCRTTENLLTAMTRNILEKETKQLESIGLAEGDLVEALDARADFYAACYNNQHVRRLGFSPEDHFPIPRSSFAGRAQKPTRKEDEDGPPQWTVSVERIHVSSPNWDKEDQRTRKWKGQDVRHHPCYFVIDDEEFWHRVKLKDLHTDVTDSLVVQLASRIVDGKVKERRVLRVLEFNGTELAAPLPTDALNAILGNHTPQETLQPEPTLFDWRKHL